MAEKIKNSLKRYSQILKLMDVSDACDYWYVCSLKVNTSREQSFSLRLRCIPVDAEQEIHVNEEVYMARIKHCKCMCT